MEIVPRHYQQTASKKAVRALCTEKRALVVLATALGKTITAALIAKSFKARRILFLVHNNFILDNAVKEFRKVFAHSKTYAVYNGLSKEGAFDVDIVFASFQTIGRNLHTWSRKHFDLVIVDESHHSHAKTYRPSIEYFLSPRLAITATPNRSDLQDIRTLFGPEVVNISLEEAIAKNWLPRIEYHVITDESLDEDALQKIATEIREGHRRFTMAEVNRRIFIRKRDNEIARIINGYNEKAVVFCPSIRYTERIRKSLDLAATFHSLTGKTSKQTWERNQKVLENLHNGIIRRVCAVNAFNEGVNVPTVGLIALCRVTQEPNVFYQQIGRGCRPGKEKLIVLDFVGNLERIKLILEMVERIKKFLPPGTKGGDGTPREKFEVSGKGFEFTFSEQIVDLVEVMEHIERDFYPTWKEASKAAQNLGIKSSDEYRKKFRLDLGLPSAPAKVYNDFPGWGIFLATGRQDFRGIPRYTTWQLASRAARKLGIFTAQAYNEKYQQDPKLPSSPLSYYSTLQSWRVFFGKLLNYYPTWEKASKAARALGITSRQQYYQKRVKDPKLPGAPESTYKDFPGWVNFLGKRHWNPYPTWDQAARAVLQLGVRTNSEYTKVYKKNPRLPRSLYAQYPDFPGWHVFLRNGKRAYSRWQLASQAAQKLGIKTKTEYAKKYKADPCLKSNPSSLSGFPGWKKFLGKE